MHVGLPVAVHVYVSCVASPLCSGALAVQGALCAVVSSRYLSVASLTVWMTTFSKCTFLIFPH